jgi:hypothetical protein
MGNDSPVNRFGWGISCPTANNSNKNTHWVTEKKVTKAAIL